jgi:predicted RNA binding protein YcfA (HicA-like mRNA interferase family)
VRLPRDTSGPQLVKALAVLDYEVTRQKGSHIRITTQRNGENHEVIPHHHPIKQARFRAFSSASQRITE